MTMVFLYSKWMTLPLSTKALLSKEFGFAKTGPTHVSNDRVVDDGYRLIDVENAMNLDAIMRYVGSDDKDFTVIWDKMIDKVEGRTITVETPPDPLTTTAPETITEKPKAKKRVKTK